MCHDSCHDLQECASPTLEVSTRARCRRVWLASENVSRVSPHSSAMASARQESPLGGGTSDHRGPGACAGLPPVGAPVRWRMPDHCLCQHDTPGDPSCLQQRLFCLVQRSTGAEAVARSAPTVSYRLTLTHPNLVSRGLQAPAGCLAHARPAPFESSVLAVKPQ